MNRPAVLLVEPEASLRRELGRGLSELGYEVVPAVGVEEGLRFAAGLGPAVVVADSALPGFGDGSVLDRWTSSNGGRTLVLLGRRPEQEEELPEEVLFVPAEGVEPAVLVRKIRLVLLGRQIGVEPDARLEALVGDLALLPPLELVRSLEKAAFSGRMIMNGGEIVFDRGTVAAAAAGDTRGVKAFCRLGRRLEGVVRLWPGYPLGDTADREIDESVTGLAIRAVEDASVGEFPPFRTRLRVDMGPALFQARLTQRQQEILQLAHQGSTVGALLDAFPATDGEILQDLLFFEETGLARLEEPEAEVRVVTDSTADLPEEVRQRLGIEVVPLRVLFGEQRFKDGVELPVRRFYEMLEGRGAHPSTEPPPEADFRRLYRELLARQDVVSIHLSAAMSETYAHARAAAASGLGGAPRADGWPAGVYPVDSRQVSLGLGLMALFAARLALRGASAVVIAERLEVIKERIHTLFVVNTLEYLARGGRIGRARALVGQVLGIKPILGVREGEVTAIDRVRGGRAAHPRIVELLAERVDPAHPLIVGVAHAKAPVWADRLASLVQESFEVAELFTTEIGAVVGTHAGPGTVGVVAFQPSAEELELLAPIGDQTREWKYSETELV